MHPEAAFLAGYAIALVGLAAGLVALGRRSTDPWSSKVLAGSRPPASERPDEQGSWLDGAVPAFHLGVSSVALGAALVLTAASALRYHRPLDVVAQVTLLAVISLAVFRLSRHRVPEPAPRDVPSRRALGSPGWRARSRPTRPQRAREQRRQ